MRRWLLVSFVFVVTACSRSPEVQNDVVMTPELKVLESTLKAKLDEIIGRDLAQPEMTVAASGSTSQPQGPVANPTRRDSVTIIDTSTNYAYSNKIGFYKEDPYIRDESGIYRNSKGEILSTITPSQIREMQDMSQDERQGFLSRHIEALSVAGLVTSDIEALASSAVHAPYREIDTISTDWFELMINVVLGKASRMGAGGVGVESANNFIGVTSPKTVMDIGFYSNSYFYNPPTDSNPRWGGFVNVYDSVKYPNGAYFDFGAATPSFGTRILTNEGNGVDVANHGFWTNLYVRADLSNGGLVAAIFQYYDWSGGPNVAHPFKNEWRYFLGLSAKSSETRLYRSSSLLSKDGSKSLNNYWGPSYLWKSKADAGNGNNRYINFSTSNASPNTNVRGNEYPYETCRASGGIYDSGPVYINCKDTSSTYSGAIDFIVRY
jgi:hypothetical protein